MKKTIIWALSLTMLFALVYCEKIETETDVSKAEAIEKEALNNSDSRINYIKSSNVSDKNYEEQQAFELQGADLLNDTVVGFVVEYKMGETYQPHEFDLVWDGNLETGDDEKLWMNLNVYHKTKEENPQSNFVDSTSIVIPDLMTLSDETKPLWIGNP